MPQKGYGKFQHDRTNSLACITKNSGGGIDPPCQGEGQGLRETDDLRGQVIDPNAGSLSNADRVSSGEKVGEQTVYQLCLIEGKLLTPNVK